MISFESEETKLENGIQKTKKHSLFQYIIVVAAACLVYGVMQGVHDNYGIMMNGLVEYTGISYSSISFCIGIGALVYGLGQPLFGLIALKKSNTYVILIGITLTIIGLVVTPLCKSVPSLLLFFGLVLPFGTTGLGFAIVMGAITPVLGAKRAAIVSGIVQASAGIGDALMSPALASLISEFDVRAAMSVFGILFLVMTPMAFWLRGQNKRAAEQVKEVKTEKRPIGEVVKAAFKDHDYHMIQMGFATCGFNTLDRVLSVFSVFVLWDCTQCSIRCFDHLWDCHHDRCCRNRISGSKILYEKRTGYNLCHARDHFPWLSVSAQECFVCVYCCRFTGIFWGCDYSAHHRYYQQKIWRKEYGCFVRNCPYWPSVWSLRQCLPGRGVCR